MATEGEYDVQADLDVSVPMRDGLSLSTDIYRPVDPATNEPVESPKPALLDRTPYGKRGRLERHGKWYAARGYVVAIQDVRGRFDSDGAFRIFVNEAEDGYDTVEWLAERPYCDGQVGTLGTSYGAWVQNALATQDPPHLAAMFVNQGAANGRTATFRHNGAFELRWLCWAFTLGGGFAKRALGDSDIQERLAAVDVRDVLADSPLQEGQSALRHIPEYEDWLFEVMSNGSASDDLWQSPGLNFEAYYDQSADVPTVYAGGWYDSYTIATVKNFRELRERKSSDHFLLVGPWTHGWDAYPLPSWNKPYAGEAEFGESSLRNFQETRLRFFDQYLKGKDTWDQPPIEYYRMGTGDGHQSRDGRIYHGGEWDTAQSWPTPATDRTRFYPHGDGTLRRSRPESASASTTFTFDPDDPVPTIGGNCSSYITYEPREESILEYPLSERKMVDITGRGGYDQRTRPDTFGASPPYGPLEHRNDVLVYRTPPLEEPLTITGPISVTVFGASDAPDTDFTAKLIDEYPPSEEFPNGFALNLCDSICRGRYRGNRDEPDPIEQGEIHKFKMEPYPTSNMFKTGHSIRLDISSSNFPRFDVNQNTGDRLYGGRESRVVRNTVFHERDHATYVDLPVQTGTGSSTG